MGNVCGDKCAVFFQSHGNYVDMLPDHKAVRSTRLLFLSLAEDCVVLWYVDGRQAWNFSYRQ